jgi:SAM-dependent methyltransferase
MTSKSFDDPCWCGEHEATVLCKGAGWIIARCKSCATGRTVPPPLIDAKDLHCHYSNYARNTNRLDFHHYEGLARVALQTFERISQFEDSDSKSALDIGCSTGSLVYVMSTKGYRATGVDIDGEAIRSAKLHYSVDALEGTVESFVERGAKFDIIVFNHVLEHIHKPLEMLFRAKRILKPEGRVWITLPNIDSVRFYIQRERTWFLQIQEHVWHFNRRSLYNLLAAGKFCDVRSVGGRLREYRNWVRIGWRHQSGAVSVVSLIQNWQHNAIELLADSYYLLSRASGDSMYVCAARGRDQL